MGYGRGTVDIDPEVAHASRVYDYLVGGADHFPVDRRAAEAMAEGLPGRLDGARSNARTNRLFLGQAVRYLAGEAGVTQFLDIGPGIPTVNQTHEVAQALVPAARVAYVDNDPIVLARAHDLLRGTPEGEVAFLGEDLRDPVSILARAAETLDFTRPVALVLVAVMHLVPDAERPYRIVARLVEALAPGSYLVLTHLTADVDPEVMTTSVQRLSAATREEFVVRRREEVARFLDGLEPVGPGLAQIDDWLRAGLVPLPADPRPPIPVVPGWRNPLYAAIARKP